MQFNSQCSKTYSCDGNIMHWQHLLKQKLFPYVSTPHYPI